MTSFFVSIAFLTQLVRAAAAIHCPGAFQILHIHAPVFGNLYTDFDMRLSAAVILSNGIPTQYFESEGIHSPGATRLRLAQCLADGFSSSWTFTALP